MRNTAPLWALLALVACSPLPNRSDAEAPAVSEAPAAVTAAECAPAESFGAVPDDGLDDRAALQAALNAGCLRLGAGRYDVVTPPYPRPVALLVMPPGATITGIGPQSRLVFSGDPMGHDWRGIQVRTGARIDAVAMSVRDMSLQTSEQTHVMRVDGPESDISIHHVSIDHPIVDGSRRGDCIQFVGYPPVNGGPDKRITDVTVAHVDFLRCARSGIAVHSGLHGFAFADNRFLGVSDQDLDFEGSGDIVDGDVSGNEFSVPERYGSAVSVSIVASENIRIHHNLLNGRGLDLYGCSGCEVHHNRVILSVPYTGSVVSLQKLSHTVRFHDEVWERTPAAGNGPMLVVADRVSAPDDVSVEDVRITQGTTAVVVQVWGIVGFRAAHLAVDYSGGPGVPGVLLNGSADATAVRSTDVHLTDSSFRGPLKWVVLASGSYAGLGTIEVSRVTADGATLGLACSGVAVGNGITGPIQYSSNVMPAPNCAPLAQ